MSGYITEGLTIQPDQIQVTMSASAYDFVQFAVTESETPVSMYVQFIDPVMIVLMIPTFEKCIYPILAKFKIFTKPLQRMTAGAFLCALAFVASGIVELKLDVGWLSNESNEKIVLLIYDTDDVLSK
jgi:dipeptide/tripeptide permease